MIKKGIEIKLNVQPIYIGLVHKYFFEDHVVWHRQSN